MVEQPAPPREHDEPGLYRNWHRLCGIPDRAVLLHDGPWISTVSVQASPNLIIGLGKTGLQAGKLIHQWRHHLNTAAPDLAGVSFAPLDGFPASNFVQLSIRPETV